MIRIEVPRRIGQVIKKKRLEMGFTQEELAKYANTSRSLIYRLEKGTTNGISLDKLFDILKVLKLELAITELEGSQKRIHKVVAHSDAHSDPIRVKKRSAVFASSHKSTSDKNSSRNTQAQREKELRAIQNIKGLDARRYLKG